MASFVDPRSEGTLVVVPPQAAYYCLDHGIFLSKRRARKHFKKTAHFHKNREQCSKCLNWFTRDQLESHMGLMSGTHKFPLRTRHVTLLPCGKIAGGEEQEEEEEEVEVEEEEGEVEVEDEEGEVEVEEEAGEVDVEQEEEAFGVGAGTSAGGNATAAVLPSLRIKVMTDLASIQGLVPLVKDFLA